MEENGRRQNWQRNPRLEPLLRDLNSFLATAGTPPADVQSPPAIFIVGLPRAGTTLVLQMLAASGLFAYPSNFISRFWQAPHIGQLVQSMMLDERFDFRGELRDLANGVELTGFSSNLGKTLGALQPNEFWYFWRRFFDWEDAQQKGRLGGLEAGGAQFRHALAAWFTVAGKPVALKGMIANWYLDQLASLWDDSVFLLVRRDPIASMQSLLGAREAFYGDRAHWYSFDLPNWLTTRGLSPEQQVALQVAAHDVIVPRLLDRLPADRRVSISFDALIDEPGLLERGIRGSRVGARLEGGWNWPEGLTMRSPPQVAKGSAQRGQLELLYSQALRTVEAAWQDRGQK